MKENLFSEKDSLELISQMLKQTKQNMEVGSGNVFLYYGYSAFAEYGSWKRQCFPVLWLFGFYYCCIRYGLFHCQSVMGSYMVSDVCSGYSDED